MDQLDGSARRNSYADLFSIVRSFGRFAYSKIDLSVCTLSQLPSPTKALFISRDVPRIQKLNFRDRNFVVPDIIPTTIFKCDKQLRK